jgi:preprotein translocase subunit SecG
MYSFLISIHVIVCILLIIVILLQASKGGGLAGVFGGGAMNAVFGGRGAGTFLSHLTTAFAILFMVLSLVLGLITKGGTGDQGIVGQERAKGGIETPADVFPTVPTNDNQGGSKAPQQSTPSGSGEKSK